MRIRVLAILLSTLSLVGCKLNFSKTKSLSEGADLYKSGPLTICFMETSKSTNIKELDRLNQVVRETIEKEWVQKAGIIQTTGWIPCADLPPDLSRENVVEIKFFDCRDDADCAAQGYTSSRSPQANVGRPPKNGDQWVPSRLSLRRTFDNHWAKQKCTDWMGDVAWQVYDNIENCTRAYTAHEFGHILGFGHEQRHPDSPADCEPNDGKLNPNAAGVWLCSKGYDAESVMNYCGKGDRIDRWSKGLSKTDVDCAKELYAPN